MTAAWSSLLFIDFFLVIVKQGSVEKKNLYGLSDILKKCNAKYLNNFPTFRILRRAIWVSVLH